MLWVKLLNNLIFLKGLFDSLRIFNVEFECIYWCLIGNTCQIRGIMSLYEYGQLRAWMTTFVLDKMYKLKLLDVVSMRG